MHSSQVVTPLGVARVLSHDIDKGLNVWCASDFVELLVLGTPFLVQFLYFQCGD